MFLLSKAVSQFGVRPEVVRIAASMMRAKRGMLRAAFPCTHPQYGGVGFLHMLPTPAGNVMSCPIHA